MSATKHKTVQVRVSAELHKRIAKLAKKLGHPHSIGSVTDDAIKLAFSSGDWYGVADE